MPGKTDTGLPEVAGQPGFLLHANRLLGFINRFVAFWSMLAVVVACLVLTYGVLMRYLFREPTDWQDEMTTFLLVGAVFLSGASVQAQRGHVSIDALAGYLTDHANRWRIWFCDLLSLLFCTFFCWKSWTLLNEAWSEGMTTDSTWAPPLWIPYGLMAVGMTLLSVQLLMQVLSIPSFSGRQS